MFIIVIFYGLFFLSNEYIYIYVCVCVCVWHRTKIRCVWKKGVRRKEKLKTWILRKKIVIAFIQHAVVKKVCFRAFFLHPLLGDGGVVIVGLLILSYQSNCWQAGYDMGRGVMDLCWTHLETCLELPKSRYLVSLYSDLMDQFEGSMITSENSSVAR